MKKPLFLFLFLLLASSNGAASSLCLSGYDCTADLLAPVYEITSPSLGPIFDYTSLKNTVYVSGNLYLDYSLFGNSDVLNFSGRNVSFFAQQVTIQPYEEKPIIVDSFEFYKADLSPYTLNETGSFLLYSDGISLLDSEFVAGGSLFIANYSAIVPVPLPSAFVLLLSTLAALTGTTLHSRSFLFRA